MMADATGSVMYWAVLPEAWKRHADRLRRSAEHLWTPLDRALTLQPPFTSEDLALWDHSYAFLLVAGAALEAMLKAAAIQAHFNVNGFKDVLTPQNQLQGWVLTHKLVKLAKRASMPLSGDEEDQLERFTKYVEWAGSYPAPKNLNSPDPLAVIRFDYRVSNFDRVWFDRLYQRAEGVYRKHVIELEQRATTHSRATPPDKSGDESA